MGMLSLKPMALGLQQLDCMANHLLREALAARLALAFFWPASIMSFWNALSAFSAVLANFSAVAARAFLRAAASAAAFLAYAVSAFFLVACSAAWRLLILAVLAAASLLASATDLAMAALAAA